MTVISGRIQSQLQAHYNMDKSTNISFRAIKELSITLKEQQYTNIIKYFPPPTLKRNTVWIKAQQFFYLEK